MILKGVNNLILVVNGIIICIVVTQLQDMNTNATSILARLWKNSGAKNGLTNTVS